MASTEATTGRDTMSVVAEVREGEYGDRGRRRRARRRRVHPPRRAARQPAVKLFWTWMSPNLEFATVFVGVLAVAASSARRSAQAIARDRARHGARVGLPRRARPPAGRRRRPADDPVPDPVRVPRQRPAGRPERGHRRASAGSRSTASAARFALNALTNLPKRLCLLIVVVAQIVDRLPRPQLPARVRADRVPVARRSRSCWPRSTIVRQGRTRPAATGRRWRRRLPAHPRRHLRVRRRLEPLRQRLHPLPHARRSSKRATGAVGRARRLRLLRRPRDRSARCPPPSPPRRRRSPTDGRSPSHMPTLDRPTSCCWRSRSAPSRPTPSTSTPARCRSSRSGFRLPLTLRARDRRRRCSASSASCVAWTGLGRPAASTRTSCWSSRTGSGRGSAWSSTDWYLRRAAPGRRLPVRHASTTRARGWVAMLVAMAVSILLFSNQTQVRRPSCRTHVPRSATSPSRSASCSPRRSTAVLFPLQRDRTDEVLDPRRS